MHDVTWVETATWVGIVIAVCVAVYLAVFRETGVKAKPLTVRISGRIVVALVLALVAAGATFAITRGSSTDARVADLEQRWERARLHDNQYDVNARRRWFCVWGPERHGGECFREDHSCREAAIRLGVGCIESFVAWCDRPSTDWPLRGCFLSKKECGADCNAIEIDDCFVENSQDPACLRDEKAQWKIGMEERSREWEARRSRERIYDVATWAALGLLALWCAVVVVREYKRKIVPPP